MSLSCGHSKTLSLISTRGQPTKYSIETVTVVAGAPSIGVTLTIRGAHDRFTTATIAANKKRDILELRCMRCMDRDSNSHETGSVADLSNALLPAVRLFVTRFGSFSWLQIIPKPVNFTVIIRLKS